MEAQKSKLIYIELQDFLRRNESCVLTTVTATQGSTPQKSGSSAIFDAKKLLAGTIGGGTTELAVSSLAGKVIRSKKSGYYSFNLNNDISEAEAAICGGGMSVLIDAQPENSLPVFEALNQSFSNRIPGILISVCTCNAPSIFNLKRYWLTNDNRETISKKVSPLVFDAAVEMLNSQKRDDFREIKFQIEKEERMAFLELIVPLPQLVIAGAGHVGKALSHLGKLLDFEVIVWDDRKEFANPVNLPNADKILDSVLEDTLEKFQPAKDSYIVIVTRGHKNDADVLRKFIGSDAGYIGMIGSRKKITQVRESFINNGWATNEEWNRVYTPIGLEIGSKTVEEIAVSIAAQLIQVRNKNGKA